MDTDSPQSVMDATVSRNLTTNAPVTNRELLGLLNTALDKAFPGVVESITLFGSQINGTADEDSDWDILLTLTQEYSWEIRDRLYTVCFEIGWAHAVLFDVKIISRSELDTGIRGKNPIFQAALHEGITL